MLGIIVILGITWVVLHFTLGKNLTVLGLSPFYTRLKQFLSGFLVAALLCTLCQLLESGLDSYEWVVNPEIKLSDLTSAFWWDFKSVLTEELFFRGGLLYLLIHKLGNKKGILLSAIFFGVYHWFSMGLFGNVVPMIIVFLGTGLMGLVWGYAFDKTGSIFLPVGLHLGWNFTFNTIFSKGPLGTLLLIQNGGEEITGWASLLNLSAWLILVPLLMFLFIRYKHKPNSIDPDCVYFYY